MAERKGRPRPGVPVSLLPDERTLPAVTAIIHPSSILCAPDEASRRNAMQGFVADLRSVAARRAEAETEQP